VDICLHHGLQRIEPGFSSRVLPQLPMKTLSLGESRGVAKGGCDAHRSCHSRRALFLAVAAPNISTAQSPKAKAAKAVVGVVKQTSRLKWSTSQGFCFDPPYKLFGSDRAVVDKVPNAVRWIGDGGTSFGAGAWWCHNWSWCTKPAEAKGP
jgi:hypothetical protein